MAVNPTVPLPKSAPDVAKINTFNVILVTVTRFMQARGTVGTAILTTQRMSKDALFALAVSLPLQHGPGFYKFDVYDEGGMGNDEWLVKLGPEQPQEGYSMAGPTGILPPGPGAGVPVGEGVVHLGHGFYYNEALSTLTTPWRTVHNWKQGDPMPTQPTSASAAPHLSLVPQNAAPGSWPQGGGWGNFPVNESTSARERELEARIAASDRRVDEERRDRAMETLRTEMRQQAQEQNLRFEKLIERMAAKPAGPSDELLEMRRSNERLERESAELRRESTQRERDLQLRAEMKDQQSKFELMIREVSANKQDPMLPMIMQMMQASQASAQEAVKAIQASTTAAATSSERSTQQMLAQLSASMMNPMQLMQMVESARSTGAEGSKLLVESMKESLGMQREVFGQLLDVAGQGQQPPWVSIVNEALSKVGAVGEALARRQQQQTPPPPQPRPAQQQQQQRPPQQQQAPRPPQQQVPSNGAPAASLPPAQTPPTAAAPAPKGKKGKGKSVEETPTPPAGQKGYTIEQLRDASVEDIRASVAPLGDDEFFGPVLLPFAKQIREEVKSGMKAEGAAEMLLRNRAHLAAIGTMPPAVELLYAEQLEVLIERLLPDAAPEYRQAVEDVIDAKFEEEESAAEE